MVDILNIMGPTAHGSLRTRGLTKRCKTAPTCCCTCRRHKSSSGEISYHSERQQSGSAAHRAPPRQTGWNAFLTCAAAAGTRHRPAMNTDDEISQSMMHVHGRCTEKRAGGRNRGRPMSDQRRGCGEVHPISHSVRKCTHRYAPVAMHPSLGTRRYA